LFPAASPSGASIASGAAADVEDRFAGFQFEVARCQLVQRRTGPAEEATAVGAG
jgi:hypothetical protein